MKIIAMIAVLLLAASARAIELSLEENRGERGSVGYVDMQRLFANSPDSQRAKEGFEELVRQAEERVNLRKAELLRLRQELDATRVERDALAHSMSLAPSSSTAAPAAALVPAVTPPAAVPAPAPAASTAAATAAPAAPAGPALSPAAEALIAASTAPSPAGGRARELALPGMAATEPEPVAPPASSTAPAAAKPGVPSSDGAAAVPAASKAAPTAAKSPVPSSDGAAAVPPPASKAAPAVSSAAVSAAAGMFPAPAPAAPVAKAPAGPTPAQRLLELDAKIISLQADIAHKESELTQEHDDADKGLLDVESRKTDRVLASLYRAVSEVARREGVSVVVDKTTILYGQPAVDLTDKVLKYLEEKSKETPIP